MKYIVIELQTGADGAVGNLVWAHDSEDAAWSKYHAVLSAAAVSELPMHAATLLRSDGTLVESRCFVHGQDEPGEGGE